MAVGDKMVEVKGRAHDADIHVDILRIDKVHAPNSK